MKFRPNISLFILVILCEHRTVKYKKKKRKKRQHIEWESSLLEKNRVSDTKDLEILHEQIIIQDRDYHAIPTKFGLPKNALTNTGMHKAVSLAYDSGNKQRCI